MEKQKLRVYDKLYFPVKWYNFNNNTLEEHNLFAGYWEKIWIAKWIHANKNPKPTKEDQYILDNHRTLKSIIDYLFMGTYFSRCEYEFMVNDKGEIVGSLWDDYSEMSEDEYKKLHKEDVYRHFIEPNTGEILMYVNRVPLGEANKILKAYRAEQRSRLHGRA